MLAGQQIRVRDPPACPGEIPGDRRAAHQDAAQRRDHRPHPKAPARLAAGSMAVQSRAVLADASHPRPIPPGDPAAIQAPACHAANDAITRSQVGPRLGLTDMPLLVKAAKARSGFPCQGDAGPLQIADSVRRAENCPASIDACLLSSYVPNRCISSVRRSGPGSGMRPAYPRGQFLPRRGLNGHRFRAPP
jgi:hypothetical protein